MIVVDGNELNLSVAIPGQNAKPEEKQKWEALSPNEQWAIKEMQKIRQKRKVILTDTKPKDLYRMALKPKTGFDISGKRSNPDTGVSEQWQFCVEKPKVINGQKVYKTHNIQFWNRLALNPEKQADMIFMISEIVKSGNVGLKILDKKKEAQKIISARKAESAAEYWLFNKCTDKDVTNLSYRWGLQDVDEKSGEELRVELFDFIKIRESQRDLKRGFEAFVNEMTSNSEVIKIGSAFHKAYQAKQIGFNPQTRKCFWTGTNESIGPVISPQVFKRDKEEYIIQWLADNPKEAHLFMESIDPKYIKEVEETVSEPEEKTEDYRSIKNLPKLRSVAKKDLGLIIPMDKKWDEAIEIIETHIANEGVEV